MVLTTTGCAIVVLVVGATSVDSVLAASSLAGAAVSVAVWSGVSETVCSGVSGRVTLAAAGVGVDESVVVSLVPLVI